MAQKRRYILATMKRSSREGGTVSIPTLEKGIKDPKRQKVKPPMGKEHLAGERGQQRGMQGIKSQPQRKIEGQLSQGSAPADSRKEKFSRIKDRGVFDRSGSCNKLSGRGEAKNTRNRRKLHNKGRYLKVVEHPTVRI